MAAIDHLLGNAKSTLDLGEALARSAQNGATASSQFRQSSALTNQTIASERAAQMALFEMSLRAGKALGEGTQVALEREMRGRQLSQEDERIRLAQENAGLRRDELEASQGFRNRELGLREGEFGLREAEFRADQPLRDARGRILSGIGRGGSGTDAVVRGDFSSVTPEDLVPHLGEGLAQYAPDFVEAGRKYNLDPRFLASISKFETGNGTSSAFRNKNNALGTSNADGPIAFGSVKESIDHQAASLARQGGHYDGKNTIGEIGATYSPPGAGNDPNSTNHLWPESVTKFYTAMAGGGRGPAAPSASGGSAPDTAQVEQQAGGEEPFEGPPAPEREPDGTRPEDPEYDALYIRELPPAQRTPFRKRALAEAREIEDLSSEIEIQRTGLDQAIEQIDERIAAQIRQEERLAGVSGGAPELVAQRDQLIAQRQKLHAQSVGLRRAQRKVGTNLEATKPEFKVLGQTEREAASKVLEVSQRVGNVRESFKRLGQDRDGNRRIKGYIETWKDKVSEDLDLAKFRAATVAAMPAIARDLFGEKGVLTDQDMARVAQALPNVRDSQELGVELLDTLDEILSGRVKSIINGAKLASADVAELREVFKAEGFDIGVTGLSQGGARMREVAEALPAEQAARTRSRFVDGQVYRGPNGERARWSAAEGRMVPVESE